MALHESEAAFRQTQTAEETEPHLQLVSDELVAGIGLVGSKEVEIIPIDTDSMLSDEPDNWQDSMPPTQYRQPWTYGDDINLKRATGKTRQIW